MTVKVNYLNNKDMLLEIHRSKTSYCSFAQPEYHQYDLILSDTSKINIRTIAEAKRARAKRMGQQEFERRKSGGEKIKIADCEVDYKKIAKTDVVFRIMRSLMRNLQAHWFAWAKVTGRETWQQVTLTKMLGKLVIHLPA